MILLIVHCAHCVQYGIYLNVGKDRHYDHVLLHRFVVKETVWYKVAAMAAQRSLLFFFVLVFTSLLLLAGLTLEVRSGGASDSFLSRRIEVQNEKITSSEE